MQYHDSNNLLFLEDKVHEENWRILTNKEIYAMVKKPTITEPIQLKRFHWLGMYREWKKTEFPEKY